MQPLPSEQRNDWTLLKKSVAMGVGAGVAYFILIFLLFGAWVHYFYAGSYSGPLWISTFFGITDKSLEAGARPVFHDDMPGWDGQFYYTQSNDPLLQDNYKDSKIIDNVSYRYQRNGLPLLAWTTAKLCGYSRTTPLIYFLTQIGIVSLGFGLLVGFLRMNRFNPTWACVWGFYGGVLRPMSHGLPDPTADSLLLMSCLAVLNRRLWIYALASSVLVLCRESYAAPAAAIWLLTLLGRIDWNRGYAWRQRIVATTLPGLAVLLWAFYVAKQTNTDFLAGSRSIPWGGLVDWPFKAYFTCLWVDIKASDEHDAIYATSCALCLFIVSALVLRGLQKSAEFQAILPHIVLMSMTGWIVWEAGVGFFKNTSSVVLIGTLMLARVPSRLLKTALLFTFLASLHYVYRADVRHQNFLPPLSVQGVADTDRSPKSLVPSDHEAILSSRLELIASESVDSAYAGLFVWFHREPRQYTVRVTNTSNVSWPASIPGSWAISVGRVFKKGKMVLQEDRVPLYKDVAAGESIEITFSVPYSVSSNKKRLLRVSMVQDSREWFYKLDETQKLDIPY